MAGEVLTVVAAYLGGIVALVVTILGQGRGINKRIDDLRQKVIGRTDQLTGELRQTIR